MTDESHVSAALSALTSDERFAAALTSSGRRIEWGAYSDAEMKQLALLADRYGYVNLLRKIRAATMRRDQKGRQ